MGEVGLKSALAAYAGKEVFVTGHTGFKGSWLTYLLWQTGAEVTGFALPPEPGPSHFEMLDLRSKIRHVEGDIRDGSALRAALIAAQPEFVFHMAAQALVRRSYADPIDTFATNVMGSVNLLDAVRRCKSVRSLVYVTSDKCYENVDWVWGYRENDALGGHDPYSASKAAAEIVFSSYARSFFSSRVAFGAATTRSGNVIGGGDWASDRIVPDCIRAIEKGLPVQLRSPHAIRPWQHVLEPLSGYLVLGARLYEQFDQYAGSWNFGPASSEARTVHDLATSIVSGMGRGSIEVLGEQSRDHEAHSLLLNCDKAHHLIGWYPRWNFEKTVSATARWYRTVLEGGDAEAITVAQIKEYFPELSSSNG